ncbi:MAG: hypothetical protein WAN69_14890 [Candidatus Korobacteraceae bacterium]
MSRKHQFNNKLFQKWSAVFFALVMAGFGFVQAVHVHDAVAGQTSPASHCSLCVVAHSAAVTSPVNAAPAPAIETTTLDLSEPQLLSRLQVVSSFIRPPPASL